MNQQQQQRRRAPLPTYIICILFLLGCTVFALAIALYAALSAGSDDLVDGSFRPTFVIDKDGYLFLREQDVAPFAKAQIKTSVKHLNAPEEEANDLLNDGQLCELVETVARLYTPQADFKELVHKIEAMRQIPGLEAKFEKVFLQPIRDFTTILPNEDESDASTEPKPNMRGSFVDPEGVVCGDDDDTDKPQDTNAVPSLTDDELRGEVYYLKGLFEPEGKTKPEKPVVGENILAATAGPNGRRDGCRRRTVSEASHASPSSTPSDDDDGDACGVGKNRARSSSALPCVNRLYPDLTEVANDAACNGNAPCAVGNKGTAPKAPSAPSAPSLSAAA